MVQFLKIFILNRVKWNLSLYIYNIISIFTDPKYAVPIKDAFCVVPNKIILLYGTIQDYNITIYNECGGIPGNFYSNTIRPCRNNTLTGKVCAPKEEIDKIISDLFLGTLVLDHYIDLNKYEHAKKPIITTYFLSLLKRFTKLTFFRIKNTFITTDTGIILEDPQPPLKFQQIDSIRT